MGGGWQGGGIMGRGFRAALIFHPSLRPGPVVSSGSPTLNSRHLHHKTRLNNSERRGSGGRGWGTGAAVSDGSRPTGGGNGGGGETEPGVAFGVSEPPPML